MREMKDSGIEWIGKVPSTWNILRNKNAFFCTKNLVGTESTNTQLLSLTTKGIRKKDINNAEGKLPESFDTYQYVRENDIVMCLFDLDCSAVFSGISFHNGMISPAYRVLTCKKSIVPRYAHYWFNYVSDGRKFNHYAKNIRYTISYDEFSTLPILCPDIETQQRISAYLDEKCTKIDTIIEKQQKIIEKLKAYKLSLITETVTKGLNPDVKMKDSGVKWIGEIPEHWNTATISKVANLYNGDRSNNYPSGTDIVDEGILFVTSNNLNNIELDTNIPTNKFITKQKYDSLRGAKLKINDIIFCLRGSVGKCGINYKYNAGTIASSLVCIRSVSINPSYLNYSLHTSIVVEQAKIEAIGIGSQNLSAENIARVIITIPSSQEQQEIADYLDKKCSAIDSAIEKKQALIEKLTEYKKSLIYEVVTGKKEV